MAIASAWRSIHFADGLASDADDFTDGCGGIMAHDAKCLSCVWVSSCLLATPEDLAQLIPRQIEFKKCGIIYSSSFPAESVFALCRGSVSLTLADPMGKTRIVRFVRAGELFGLDALLPVATRMFDAMAREECKLCFVDRTTFLRLMHHDGSRAWNLLLALNGLVHENDLEKMELSGQPARKRLQMALSRFRPATAAAPLRADEVIPIKQWELAQFLGLSVETVSRQMKALRVRRASPNARRV